jgi:hypothetical protein
VYRTSLGLNPDFNARKISPGDATSAPEPSLPRNVSMAMFELAFME